MPKTRREWLGWLAAVFSNAAWPMTVYSLIAAVSLFTIGGAIALPLLLSESFVPINLRRRLSETRALIIIALIGAMLAGGGSHWLLSGHEKRVSLERADEIASRREEENAKIALIRADFNEQMMSLRRDNSALLETLLVAKDTKRAYTQALTQSGEIVGIPCRKKLCSVDVGIVKFDLFLLSASGSEWKYQVINGKAGKIFFGSPGLVPTRGDTISISPGQTTAIVAGKDVSIVVSVVQLNASAFIPYMAVVPRSMSPGFIFFGLGDALLLGSP